MKKGFENENEVREPISTNGNSLFSDWRNRPIFGAAGNTSKCCPTGPGSDSGWDWRGWQARVNEGARMNPSDRSVVYQIRIEGHVRENWFEGLDIAQTPNGETLISGTFDQAALHGILSRIRDLGLVLLSVQSYPNEKGVPHE
jgi:hypothetical protein